MSLERRIEDMIERAGEKGWQGPNLHEKLAAILGRTKSRVANLI